MKKYLALLVASFVLMVPVAFAADIVPCNGPNCRACDLVTLADNIIKWLVGILTIVGAIMLAVAGLKMVTAGGNPGAISAAKETFTNIVIGFIIMLSAWLIVDTFMKMFVDDSKIGPWNEIQCVDPLSRTTDPTPTTPPVGGDPGTPPSGTLTHAQSRDYLGGITVVSSGNCTDRTNRSCTSLDGMQASALSEIKEVINDCSGCNLQITAGTEVGHINTCHVNGTCVDIRCATGCSMTQVVAVSESARENGARVVYETLSCSERDAARARGVTAYCKSDRGYGHITGNHFSLYTQ